MNLKHLAMSTLLVAGLAIADEAPKAEATDAAPVEDKLITLTTMERAFVKAINTRNQYINYIRTENAKKANATDEEKAKIDENIKTVAQNYAVLNGYLDIIFGIDNRREYEYNPVTSTIYLKVGNVRDAFIRTIQKRDAYLAKINELNTALANEKDDAKKAELQKQHDLFVAAHAQVVNALFAVYQIHPKRNYQFDADKGILYLKSNAEEVEKLQKQLEANQKAAEKK